MADELMLEIVTPEKMAFSGKVKDYHSGYGRRIRRIARA